MVDALVLGTSEATHGGSSPLPGTKTKLNSNLTSVSFCDKIPPELDAR